MKVRKFLFVGALIAASLFSVNSVMAETPTTTDKVTVNLKFLPVQSIVVTSPKVVNIIYDEKNDYITENGLSATVDDHLEIFSTGGFVVTVKAESDFISNSTGSVDILASDVKVTATRGSGNTNEYGEGLPEVTLSTSAQNFIASGTGGTGLKFNVKYDNYGGANGAYINKYIHDDTETVYTATVTYTIATN